MGLIGGFLGLDLEALILPRTLLHYCKATVEGLQLRIVVPEGAP